MKIFIGVVSLVAIIGGFIGADFTMSSFSIAWALFSGLCTIVFIFGVGAFLTAKDKKQIKKELPDEVRSIFERITGRDQLANPEKLEGNPKEFFFVALYSTIHLQLLPKYSLPRDAFAAIMTNKMAAGYVFGLHDALHQGLGLCDPKDKDSSADLIETSYKRIFGDETGYALFSAALHSQKDSTFVKGRELGASEIIKHIEEKVRALGLNRILILGMSS